MVRTHRGSGGLGTASGGARTRNPSSLRPQQRCARSSLARLRPLLHSRCPSPMHWCGYAGQSGGSAESMARRSRYGSPPGRPCGERLSVLPGCGGPMRGLPRPQAHIPIDACRGWRASQDGTELGATLNYHVDHGSLQPHATRRVCGAVGAAGPVGPRIRRTARQWDTREGRFVLPECWAFCREFRGCFCGARGTLDRRRNEESGGR
jgi:hypothetical protein